MTLILGIVNSQQAILVSDRRLTYNGQLKEKEEESNKAATLVCRDARIVIGYTGLAEQGSFQTRRWLLEALSDSAAPDFVVESIISRLRERATRDIAALDVTKPSDKRLSVILAGYRYDESPPRCYYWLVSNYEDGRNPPRPEPAPEFMVTSEREARPSETEPSLLAILGVDRAVANESAESLQTLLREGKPARALVGKAVEIVRAAADSSASEGKIGKQCTSIVLPSDQSQSASIEYHSAHPTNRWFGPSHVEARGGEFGVLIVADPEEEARDNSGRAMLIALPRVGRNQPCPCGSRKKYKRCHGR